MELERQKIAFLGSSSAISFRIRECDEPEDLLLNLARLRTFPFDNSLKSRFLTPPEFNHEERKKSWLKSRDCLLQVSEQLRAQNILPENTLFSLSHTDQASIALGAEKSALRGVGIDLEPISRALSASAASKFVNESERNLTINAIQIWVVKEACYKANPKNLDTVIPEYRITELKKTASTLEGITVIRDQKIEFLLFLFEPGPLHRFWVSIAKMRI